MSQNNASFTVKISFLPLKSPRWIVEEFTYEIFGTYILLRERFSELKSTFETSMNDIVQVYPILC